MVRPKKVDPDEAKPKAIKLNKQRELVCLHVSPRHSAHAAAAANT